MKTKLAVTLALACVSAILSSDVQAGESFSDATCAFQSDFSGFCRGTFAGFRDSPQPDARAIFGIDRNVYFFTARLDSMNYSCNGPVASSGNVSWAAAMASRGYFFISWNSSGTCGDLTIQNGSPY